MLYKIIFVKYFICGISDLDLCIHNYILRITSRNLILSLCYLTKLRRNFHEPNHSYEWSDLPHHHTRLSQTNTPSHMVIPNQYISQLANCQIRILLFLHSHLQKPKQNKETDLKKETQILKKKMG